MDLNAFNRIGESTFLPKKKFSELKVDKEYKITALKQVKTKKFGLKVVGGLDEEIEVILPARAGGAFEKDPSFLEQMVKHARDSKLALMFLGDSQFDFVEK